MFVFVGTGCGTDESARASAPEVERSVYSHYLGVPEDELESGVVGRLVGVSCQRLADAAFESEPVYLCEVQQEYATRHACATLVDGELKTEEDGVPCISDSLPAS